MSTSMLSGRTVLSRFLESAKKHPNRIAVKQCDSSISYQAIHGLILNLAGALHQLEIKPGNRIAVELTPSIELIAVLLAIQYVGAAYVPLDKKAPQERNLLIINDAKPDLIIIDSEVSLYPSFKVASIHSLISCSLASDMGDRSRLENTAYIIYTSGTTGRPKGVPITHHNLDALFSATDPIYRFNEQDATLLYHSYAFDFSVWEIWAALAYGGKLVIPDEATRLFPAELARLIKEEKITILNQTPTAFSVNADKLCQFKPGDLSLRYIIFGGERLNYQTLTRWSDKFGFKEPTLVNMYGITETTVHASWHIVSDDDLRRTESNIGYLLPNFDYIIRPLESDITMEDRGELLLSGPQVTSGYLNTDNKKSGKFIQKEIGAVARLYYCSGDIVKKITMMS